MLVAPSPFLLTNRVKHLLVQTKDLKPHKWGCLMALLPAQLRKEMTDWCIEHVPEFHRGPGGAEWKPHVTIAYGWEDNPAIVSALKGILSRVGPIQIQLGGFSLFKGNEDGDVLKVDVESQQLRDLHDEIVAKFDLPGNKHSDFLPHVTISYLLPEVSDLYEKLDAPFLNQLVTIEELEWVGADGERELIKLSFLPTIFGVKSSYPGEENFDFDYQPSSARGQPCKQGQSAEATGCIPSKQEQGQRRSGQSQQQTTPPEKYVEDVVDKLVGSQPKKQGNKRNLGPKGTPPRKKTPPVGFHYTSIESMNGIAKHGLVPQYSSSGGGGGSEADQAIYFQDKLLPQDAEDAPEKLGFDQFFLRVKIPKGAQAYDDSEVREFSGLDPNPNSQIGDKSAFLITKPVRPEAIEVLVSKEGKRTWVPIKKFIQSQHFKDAYKKASHGEDIDYIPVEVTPPKAKRSPFRGRKSWPSDEEETIFDTKSVQKGTCKQGERSDLTGCTPATGTPSEKQPKEVSSESPQEAIQVDTGDTGVPPEKAKELLHAVFNRPWGDETKQNADRWKYRLEKVRSSFGETIYQFTIDPKETPTNLGEAEIEEIDSKPDMVYRGMSWEEWQLANSTGKVQSMGSHNLEGEENMTFYGNAQTAEAYANGFTPMAFKPTPSKPGIIIEIPKKLVMSHEENKRVPASEFAHLGSLPRDVVQRVWKLVPTKIKPGRLEVLVDYRNKPQEGSRSSPSVVHKIVPFEQAPIPAKVEPSPFAAKSYQVKKIPPGWAEEGDERFTFTDQQGSNWEVRPRGGSSYVVSVNGNQRFNGSRSSCFEYAENRMRKWGAKSLPSVRDLADSIAALRDGESFTLGTVHTSRQDTNGEPTWWTQMEGGGTQFSKSPGQAAKKMRELIKHDQETKSLDTKTKSGRTTYYVIDRTPHHGVPLDAVMTKLATGPLTYDEASAIQWQLGLSNPMVLAKSNVIAVIKIARKYGVEPEGLHLLKSLEAKTLSWMNESTGGALVPPPAVGRTRRLRRNDQSLLRKKYKNRSFRVEYSKDLMGSVEGAGKWCASQWAKLEQRYGRRAALAMVAAMVATMPIPFNVAAVIGAAEAVRGLHGYITGKKPGQEPKEEAVGQEMPTPPTVQGTCKPGQNPERDKCTPAGKSLRVISSPFHSRKSLSVYCVKDAGQSARGQPCKPGQSAEITGCIPSKPGQPQQQGQTQEQQQPQAQQQEFSAESRAVLEEMRASGEVINLPDVGNVEAYELGEKPGEPGKYQAWVPDVGYVDVDPRALQKSARFAPPPEGENLTEPPCCLYDPDPEEVDPETGVSHYSRVGVPAFNVPPPPKEIPRLPNLTEKERAAEARFADAYLEDPDGTVDDFLKKLKSKELGDAPNVFSTDEAKLLSPDYKGEGLSEEEAKSARGVYNAAVHQTANAIAKKAFLKYLDDTVANLPDEQKTVLVTSGGCAAGKGHSLTNVEHTKDLAGSVGAVWDAAGEAFATENPWILHECKKRGIVPIFAFIHANPHETWENEKRGVVERANKIGRMVDAKLFTESYTLGAKNFNAFYQKYRDSGDAEFFIIDNSKGTPQLLNEFPQEALDLDSDRLYARSIQVLQDREDRLKPSVVRGGRIGERIWGKPVDEEGWGE